MILFVIIIIYAVAEYAKQRNRKKWRDIQVHFLSILAAYSLVCTAL